MNNSVYGKKMKNLRKIVKVILINNVKDYNKYVSKPSFVSQKIFSKNSVAIYEIKPVLKLDKSIYVGFIILNLSEFLIYKFHYKYTGTKYDNCAKLLFTATDSVVYELETDDVCEDFYENKYLFDFSRYPEYSKFFDPTDKKCNWEIER